MGMIVFQKRGQGRVLDFAIQCRINNLPPPEREYLFSPIRKWRSDLSKKCLELFQTIALLIISIRTETGCHRCDFCQSTEDENELGLLEEWDTQENLKSHLKSRRFRILRGAMILLKEPYDLMLHPAFYPAGKRKFNG